MWRRLRLVAGVRADLAPSEGRTCLISDGPVVLVRVSNSRGVLHGVSLPCERRISAK